MLTVYVSHAYIVTVKSMLNIMGLDDYKTALSADEQRVGQF